MLFKGRSSRLELLIERLQAGTTTIASTNSHSSTHTESGGSLVSWTSGSLATGDELSPSLSLSGDEPFTVGPTEDTPYACQFCHKAFPRLSYLNKHEQSHSEEMPFQCDFCQRLFKHKRSRDRHVKLHTGDRKYRCPHCESAFSRSDHLKIHMKTHDHHKPYQCLVCNRGYNTAAALTSHMQNHKREASTASSPSPTAFRCLTCHASFPTGEELQGHVSTQHPVPAVEKSPPQTAALLTEDVVQGVESGSGEFPCPFCRMNFSSHALLDAHRLVTHALSGIGAKAKENAFCPHCAVAFPTHAACADHFLLSHANHQPKETPLHEFPRGDPPQVMATDLRKRRVGGESPSSSTSSALGSPPAKKSAPKRSARKGTEEKIKRNGFFAGEKLLCNQCSAAFSDFESFRSHLQTHLETHLLPQPTPCRCEECAEEFPSEEALHTHALAHFLATATEYGCTACRKLYTKPDELQKHLMDIHAHHLFRCALCKEVFDSKVAIQVHFAVQHSDEARLFRCSPCNAVFHSHADFQVHVKVSHLRRASTFRCLLCNAPFPNEGDLFNHLSTHQKAFSCNLCGEAFHVEFLLDKHTETHHAFSPTSLRPPRPPDKPPNGNKASRKSVKAPKEPKCDICDVAFPSEDELSVHRKEAHNFPMQNSCRTSLSPDQGTRDSRAGDTQRQGKTNASSPTQQLSLHCAYCSENCKSRTELENHMKSHTGVGGRQKCNICDELCPTPTLLAEHKLQTHCKVATGSLCTSCKETILSEEDFYVHTRRHAGALSTTKTPLPLPCLVCRQTLISDLELSLHAKFHTEQEPRVATCCLCLRTTPTKGSAREGGAFVCVDCLSNTAAILSHPPTGTRLPRVSFTGKPGGAAETEKSYQCIKCQKTFCSEEEIQAHVATHLLAHASNDCHLCPATHFDSPLKLQTHLIEHTFEGCPSFRCFLCATLFTTPLALQKHILTHGLDERPYDCAHCRLKFFFRAELENHMHSHSHSQDQSNHSSAHGNPNESNHDDDQRRRRKRKKFFYRSDDSEEELGVPKQEPFSPESSTAGDDPRNSSP